MHGAGTWGSGRVVKVDGGMEDAWCITVWGTQMCGGGARSGGCGVQCSDSASVGRGKRVIVS